jgi:hypothetical protein
MEFSYNVFIWLYNDVYYNVNFVAYYGTIKRTKDI